MEKMANRVVIRKASGEAELYDESKLKQSLRSAGAEEKLVEDVADDVREWLYDGVSTRKMYARAFSLLRRKNRLTALRYRLKKSIFELGPTGYPFERLVGEIIKKQGYETEVGQIIAGHCVEHEMDVIATKKEEQVLAECKFAMDQGKSVSVQVPLYVRSRVDDIVKKRMKEPVYKDFKFYGWIVTNVRFSPDSMVYGKCSGLKLISWDYPRGAGLKELIESLKVFPVTLLNQLKKQEKAFLLENGIVACTQLAENREIMISMGYNDKTQKDLLKDIDELCSLF